MRKMAGISTNVLARMGKNESISLDSITKIATTLDCGLDDIVEIKNDVGKGRANNANNTY